MSEQKPIVAIVGRPNVGKSRMFNRFARQQRSIVADQPGVTRDRIYAEATLRGPEGEEHEVVLVDTGGFDPSSEDPIIRRVVDQTQLAIDEAEVIVFVTDGRAGVLPEDADIADMLRRADKPTVLAVNKLDGPKQDDLLYEFYGLGIKAVVPVSAAHGRNVGDLEDWVVAALPATGEAISEPPEALKDPSDSDPAIRVAVIGRPNAGKSSLVNRLLGEDRHVVSPVAGTTIDSVDSLLLHEDQRYLFIDTAGIRRKRSIAMRVERFSVVAALRGLQRSDVALLLIDASQPIANQDAKVSAFAYERGKAVIKVVSKWDSVKMTQGAFREKLDEELPHLAYAPTVFTSAHTGEGLPKLMPLIRRVHSEYARRVPTAQLNRFIADLSQQKAPPSKKGRHGRIYYLTQIDVRPPRFLVSVNDPELFHFAYRRFLVNELRRAYGYTGVPLLIGYRSHKQQRGEDRGRYEPGRLAAAKNPKKQATAAKRARKSGKKKKPRPTSIKRLK